MLSAICFSLDQSRILSSGNGLSDHQEAVVEEKGSPNATKVHHTKKNDSISILYFSNTLLSTKSYVVGTHSNRLKCTPGKH